MFIKFFHHLFNPHCPECRLEAECASCETLRLLLEQSNYEKQQLLKRLLEIAAPEKQEPIERAELPKPIMPKVVPWKVRQQMLETESRQQARILADKKKEVAEATKSTEELEKELGIIPQGEPNAS